MKYIDNDMSNGIAYDYTKVRKLYKSLKCPKDFYNPCTAPINKASWVVEVSQRSTGKTTGWLLWSLTQYWLYGTVTHYVRRTADEIAPKNSKSLYNVVLDNNYIGKLTNGTYNSIEYRAKKWYLCHVDEDGKVDSKDFNACTYMCSVDKASELKSTLNTPTGDIIIYDEFIPVNYNLVTCDFVEFCDLCKTIFRDRISGKIILLANTINKESQYFHELEIYNRISEMDTGESALYTTDGGTNIFIEIVGTSETQKKRKNRYNKMFLGFRNPKLSGITGVSTWSITNYPHIPDMDYKTEYRNVYISHNNKLVNLELVTNELGVCIYAHWSSQTHGDSVILTNKSIIYPNHYYGVGDETFFGKLFKYICKTRHIYFASNDVGSFVKNYLNECGINLPLL